MKPPETWCEGELHDVHSWDAFWTRLSQSGIRDSGVTGNRNDSLSSEKLFSRSCCSTSSSTKPLVHTGNQHNYIFISQLYIMKFASGIIASFLLCQTRAFNPLSGNQPSSKINVDEATNRRNFFQTAASAVVAAPLLISSRANAFDVGGKIQFGPDSIMDQKEHGTSAKPVQEDLLYGVSNKLADKICNFNRHFAERGGYFLTTSFEDEVLAAKGPITFYDSVTGKPLFRAPINRSADAFLKESEIHGWPSFRDEEVRMCVAPHVLTTGYVS